MLCTSCNNSSLEPQELEPGLVVASCPSCHGTLVSLMSYRYWVDRYLSNSTPDEDVIEADISESQSVHSCPKCSRLMMKYQIGTQSTHKLDLCSACDEAWLDKGEWQLLKKLDLHGKLPKIFTDAWQRNIRKQKQEISLNERYEKLLGVDDFNKAREFKEWLYRQPKRDAIKQYLISYQD